MLANQSEGVESVEGEGGDVYQRWASQVKNDWDDWP